MGRGLLIATVVATSWVATGPGRAHADDTVTFLRMDLQSTLSMSGDNKLAVGMIRWIDGKLYVGAYDLDTCAGYFLLRNGQAMPHGLSGESRIEAGGGNDEIDVQPVGISTYWCGSRLPLLPLNYNGFRLIIEGEGGVDQLLGGSGDTLLLGGPDLDFIIVASTLGFGHGEGGDDVLELHSPSGQVYGGAGRDFLADRSIFDQTPGQHFFGQSGSDCIVVNFDFALAHGGTEFDYVTAVNEGSGTIISATRDPRCWPPVGAFPVTGPWW